jgi:hypothetical protein
LYSISREIQAIDSLMVEDDERSAKAICNVLAPSHNINIRRQLKKLE